jgi:hypothetical protein
MATSTVSAAKECTNSSTKFSYSEAVKDTNIRAGVSKAPRASHSTYSSTPSQMQSKGGSELEPSAVSTTSSASISYKSVEEYFSPPDFEENEKHELILESMRVGTKWQQDLERVHGFTEAESCECFSRAGKYLHCDEFPDDAVNEKLFPHAKEGWVILREADRLVKEYPQELMQLDRRAGSEGKALWDFD